MYCYDFIDKQSQMFSPSTEWNPDLWEDIFQVIVTEVVDLLFASYLHNSCEGDGDRANEFLGY